jgi:hypothetical protein
MIVRVVVDLYLMLMAHRVDLGTCS